MRSLVVEDDFTCRCLLSELLTPLGPCDIAIDGEEAIYAVQLALKKEYYYDLICLDIHMPKKNGHEALRQIRNLEEAAGLWPGPGSAKIIMTTSQDDAKTIVGAFREQCDSYLVKPVIDNTLFDQLERMGLINDTSIGDLSL